MAAITYPFFASVSSSTAFGHSCILLAPAPRDRHHRRSRRVAEAYRQLCSRANNNDDNNGGHCAGDVESDSASTLVGSEDGDDKTALCNITSSSSSSSDHVNVLSQADQDVSHLLNHEHLAQIASIERQAQIKTSWLRHADLDIDNETLNGPRPHCTVEELGSAMDDFFGTRNVGTAGPKSKSARKQQLNSLPQQCNDGPDAGTAFSVPKKHSKLLRKVRALQWMV